MTDFGKVLMAMAVVLFVIGALWQIIGRLPGDIVIRKGNTVFYFPIVTSIVISVVLSLIFYLINRFR
ncbi:DUF2905 domain-containing protein [Caenibacillus caldisaponilyticus]|jgi:hypothetical protein|uniref:DUF2905 domain-containing protein n=1 Tax=Caenibacillus caldisaponilyticus TaxID=1674942 RepID=UPI0009887650|nr:DUF2905 domain-containing protein [Caenibacillus caldisaponilyticus]